MQTQNVVVDDLLIRYADSGVAQRPGHPAHQPLAGKPVRVPARLAGPGPDGAAGRDRPARLRSFAGPRRRLHPQRHGRVPPSGSSPSSGWARRTWSRPTWAPAPPCSWPHGTRTRSGAWWSAAARAAYPLEVTGTLADIIAAPGIEAFEGLDVRANIGATVEPVAPREPEPDIWEDYVSAYENGRFAESTRYVRSYPDQLQVLQAVLPVIRVPVRIFARRRRPVGAGVQRPLPGRADTQQRADDPGGRPLRLGGDPRPVRRDGGRLGGRRREGGRRGRSVTARPGNPVGNRTPAQAASPDIHDENGANQCR